MNTWVTRIMKHVPQLKTYTCIMGIMMTTCLCVTLITNYVIHIFTLRPLRV